MTSIEPVRSGRGQFIRTVETAQRDSEAARLRSLGHSYQEIADQLGIDVSNAWHAVQRALMAVVGENAEEARRLELDRIDRLWLKAEAILDSPGAQVDRLGRPVTGPDGQVQPDRLVQLQAVDRLTRLLERRARVLGSDAPKRSISVQAVLDSIPDADKLAHATARIRLAQAEIEAEQAKHAIAGEIVPEDG